MTLSKNQLEEMSASVPFWFHSISLGEGVVTKGWKSEDALERELQRLNFPDMRGKSVLDINSWDGFFAFEAERRGARSVLALDHYMWAMDLGEHVKYLNECSERGVAPAPYHTMPYYKPDSLPGKAGFDAAHKALNSKVEVRVADFMEMDLESLGAFDVVLYLGSLYHMENPMLALRRVAAVTREVAVIETEAAEFPASGDDALCEFFGTDVLKGDVSNWWTPNERALTSMCRSVGFDRVDVLEGRSSVFDNESHKPLRSKLRSKFASGLRKVLDVPTLHGPKGKVRYRAVVHAWK